MMSKRWISRLCAAFMLIALICPAHAENASHVVSEYRQSIASYDQIYNRVADAVDSGAETLSLFEYRITVEDFMRIYSDLFANAPEFFFLAPRVAYHTADGLFSDTVVDVTFQYTMTRAEREAASAFYEKEVAYIVSSVPGGLSDTEKALYVHDFIISAYGYDETESIYDTYTFLKTRTGVCQAYSLLYMRVMRELGVECAVVTSSEMRHAWNIVKIGGNWYHVDLVYDDPRPDRVGRVLHDFFLLSDDEIRARDHVGWSSTVKCGTAWPKDPLWRGVVSRMLWIDGRWYYIRNTDRQICSALFNGSDQKVLYTFKDRWMVGDSATRYWVGTYSGLSAWGGILYVNTADEILTIDPKNGTATVYLRETEAGDIYGSAIVKDTLDYMTAATPNLDGTQHIHSVVVTGQARSPGAIPFDDVQMTDPCYDAVRFVYERGLFNGVSTTKFAPGATLTRAMFVTVLGRLCGVDPSVWTTSSFTDVPPGLWYSAYVEWAVQNGIVNGVGGGLFDPLGELTKEQMMKIVATCGGMLKLGVSGDPEDLAVFADRDQLDTWAVDGAAWCAANDLLPSRTELDPKNTANRAEAASMIAGFSRLAGK
ncbi:MAG: S-layer homology domain-containing protein [Clostridiales bacterium]|nr:S-layer homology domain-containing protein [Clostridiales bacterium]